MAESELKAKVAKMQGISPEDVLSAREAEDGAIVAVTAAGQKLRIVGSDVEVLAGPASAAGDSAPPDAVGPVGETPASSVIPLREDMQVAEVQPETGGLLVTSDEEGADVMFQPTPDSQPQPAPGGVVLPASDPHAERVVDSEGTPLVSTEGELERNEEGDKREAERAEAEEAIKDKARADLAKSKKASHPRARARSAPQGSPKKGK